MRRIIVILIFGISALFTFWLFRQFMQGQIDSTVPSNNGVVNDVLWVASYSALSMIAYFIIFNLIPLAGMFICYTKSNSEDAKTFRLLALISTTITIFYSGVNW